MVVSTRKRSQRVTLRDKPILKNIHRIKAEHPSWGYRRVWAYLRYREEILIGKNRVYRLLKENTLLAVNPRTLKAKRTPMPSKPRTTKPKSLWGIDMTKIQVQSWGWLYLVVVKDWGSKKIVGWDLSTQSKTEDWLRALNKGLEGQFPQGIRENKAQLNLVSDNGCQPTSVNFMAACHLLGIKQIFTSYNNPKGNADTERVMRTIKEDLIWPREWLSFQQLKTALEQWVIDYNEDFPHSSLQYLTPQQYETKHTSKTHQLFTRLTGGITNFFIIL